MGKKVFKTEDEFWDAAYDLAEMDGDFKKQKAEYEKLKDQVKSYMIENNILDAELEDLDMEIKISDSVSNGFKEQELMNYLEELAMEEPDLDKQEKILTAIKEVRVIDSEALEALIFDGTVTEEQLKDFVTQKVTKRFTIK